MHHHCIALIPLFCNALHPCTPGQSHSELMDMQHNISAQLERGEGDPEYWDAVLERLKIHAAKAKLREIQAQLLQRKLDAALAEMAGVDVPAAMGWNQQEADAEAISSDANEDEELRPAGMETLLTTAHVMAVASLGGREG